MSRGAEPPTTGPAPSMYSTMPGSDLMLPEAHHGSPDRTPGPRGRQATRGIVGLHHHAGDAARQNVDHAEPTSR